MEKRTPHCPLERVRVLLREGKVRSTRAAIQGAHKLGLRPRQILDVIQALSPSDFYKSMTTYQDHRVWQDVYHRPTELGWIYVNLTVVDDVLVVSFKEL
ncbi:MULTISPECIES: type II toxin-antitoxin system MqsR family toxin [unclassified Pseudomonas]|uniref:type II toxin-antitoxin system MqsR family toxin n=1 Tax=unclassified Pseudomonas TaxID=196821 RepID=UPI002097769C|nr:MULTISPECIES: type II toxin-antitoxin system MqsR family toxin [unclassified Pseudomonas]MCO7520199.1 type II toxin-antitoxin system MqsR family toxin [Pseudomonas sp. 1]MCO7540465.1 type II toxin-antitoxin system MqsR family toxin [Pseudomonas sp. VA159-2]